MLVAVTGGTGTVGREVVAELLRRGHEVRVLSRRPRGEAQPGARHRSVDLSTGEGLAAAIAGADAVVDAAQAPAPARHARMVMVGGTRRLAQAARAAGVEHHVLISIVGIEDVPTAYYRVKVAQEQALAVGRTPWSIVRTTQFHPLLDGIFSAAARWRLLPAPRFPLQPIHPRVVGRALVDAVEDGPSLERRRVAGPAVESADDLARCWRERTGRSALPARVPLLGRVGSGLRRGALTAPAAAVADSPSFEEWLRERYAG